MSCDYEFSLLNITTVRKRKMKIKRADLIINNLNFYKPTNNKSIALL